MTKDNEINNLIEKARTNLVAAQKDVEDGFYDSAVSRAYYVMFYCAEALLLTKELRFSKHSAVHSALGQYFVKTNEIDPELHRILIKAFESRNSGDYEYMIKITREEAEKMLKDAEYFVNEIKKKLSGGL